jgi:hypothetical protein
MSINAEIAERIQGARFVPGVSGNTAGKKPSTRRRPRRCLWDELTMNRGLHLAAAAACLFFFTSADARNWRTSGESAIVVECTVNKIGGQIVEMSCPSNLYNQTSAPSPGILLTLSICLSHFPSPPANIGQKVLIEENGGVIRFAADP